MRIRSFVILSGGEGKREADAKSTSGLVGEFETLMLAVEFGAVPRAYSVLAYGQSNKPESPHFSDQAALFAAGQMKRVAFTEADIGKTTQRAYHPGQ